MFYLQRLTTVPSNWAFEEMASFGVFLWVVFTMILCFVTVLHFISSLLSILHHIEIMMVSDIAHYRQCSAFDLGFLGIELIQIYGSKSP